MMRVMYVPHVFLRNDYLYHVGGYRFCIITAAPEQMMDYRTVIAPFDRYVWALVFTTMTAVMTAFILIDKISASWATKNTKINLHLSMCIDANHTLI